MFQMVATDVWKGLCLNQKELPQKQSKENKRTHGWTWRGPCIQGALMWRARSSAGRDSSAPAPGTDSSAPAPGTVSVAHDTSGSCLLPGTSAPCQVPACSRGPVPPVRAPTCSQEPCPCIGHGQHGPGHIGHPPAPGNQCPLHGHTLLLGPVL